MSNRYTPFKDWEDKILSFLSTDMEKTIIFINMREHLDRIALLLREIMIKVKGQVMVVCFNSQPPVYFRNLNINLRLSEDYLLDADYKYIDEYTLTLTRTWYLVKDKDGKGMTEYENIQLGSLTEYDFQMFLICRIKNLEVINRIVKLENPHKIITMEDTGELNDAASIISQVNNISLLSLSNKPLFHSLRILKIKIRTKLSDIFYLSLFDSLIRIFLMKTRLNNLILIDPRAHALLTGPHRLENFIFCPIEKGLSNRLYSLKRKKPYISFDIPLSGKIKRQIDEQKGRFFARWVELSIDPTFRERFIYKDISIWSLVENKLFQFFKERFPRILRLIAQVKEFHRDKTIKSIILRADVREMEKTIVKTAEVLNIPTLFINHGILSENNGYDILFCTKTAVWGKADFERYISLGNPADKLAITGSPKYDRLYFKRLDLSKELIYKKLRLDSQKDFIILATQPIVKFSSYRTDDENEVLLRNVLSAIKDIPDIQLVIKLHPFEDYSMYKKILKEIDSKDIVLVRDIDIFALIEASVLLMTVNSTVGLEAMFLHKPVITINLGKRKDTLPFVERGAALGVYKAEEIAPTIERLLGDTQLKERLELSRKELVSYYVGKLDGRSSDRVVNLINKMSTVSSNQRYIEKTALQETPVC